MCCGVLWLVVTVFGGIREGLNFLGWLPLTVGLSVRLFCLSLSLSLSLCLSVQYDGRRRSEHWGPLSHSLTLTLLRWPGFRCCWLGRPLVALSLATQRPPIYRKFPKVGTLRKQSRLFHAARLAQRPIKQAFFSRFQLHAHVATVPRLSTVESNADKYAI